MISTDDLANEEEEENNGNLQINLELLDPLKNQLFVTRESNKHSPFIYQKFFGKGTKHCCMHCYFDPDYNCDFHFFYENNCYLGSFNTETPIDSVPSGTVTHYIFKGTYLSF